MTKASTTAESGLNHAILSWMQELAPQGICITDQNLRVQGWNSWLEINSGIHQEKLLGRGLLEFFPDLKARRLDVYFQKALAGEVSVLSVAFHQYLFPFPSLVAEAKFPHMLQTARIAPLMRGDEIVGTITLIEDVTEREHQNALVRKQHERQELFSWALSHLMESAEPEKMVKEIFPRISAHIGVDAYWNYLLDEDGTKLRLHSCGGVSAELQKTYATVEMGQHITGCCARDRRMMVFSKIQQNDEVTPKKARELGFSACVCLPLLVGTRLIGTLTFATRKRDHFDEDEIEFTKIVAQYVAIALDRSRNVKELHTAQTQLQGHAELLEKQVEARTHQLQESLNELETFTYSLAHDVRAPLRHIRGYAQALLEDCEKDLSPEAQRYVELILKSIRRLDALTEDILAYGQLSQSQPGKSAVNLEELLKDIITHHPRLSSGLVTVHTPLHTPVGERPLLGQCLTNLLDNAVKFVPPGLAPKIEISTQIKTEDSETGPVQWVRIFVQDNGIGIPEEFHGRIFGIFERLGKENEYEGTGIGLAIVAKAMQRMGGRLGLSSEPGKGTKFWLDLPAHGS